MGPLSGTLFVRFAGALLVLGVLFNIVMALALLAPIGRERADLYLLPLPAQAAAIVNVMEATAPEERPRLLGALNSPALTVRLVETLPQAAPQRRAVTRPLERFFSAYDDAFTDHDFHLDMRRRRFAERLLDRGERNAWIPARLYVRLHDGPWVMIEPARAALLDSFLARGLAVGGIGGLIVLFGLWFAVRQTAKPVAELASNARAFADRLDAPALAETGPKEMRDLAQAFNQMKARIRDLVAERTRVLAAIAHDLRTYLTRLKLRAEFIADSEQRTRAERDLDEMAALIDDTLLFARNDERADAEPPRTNLGAEVATFLDARREMGEPASLVGLLPAEAFVAIDRLALRRILANLTDNAVRYGGVARISVSSDASFHVVAVEDDGPGIPPPDLERVTAPFERLEPSRGRSSGGAGLGLAIVRALVEAHGGALRLTNRSPTGLRAEVHFHLAK